MYSQAQRNDQEYNAKNDQMEPPKPRAVSLRLGAISWSCVWLSRLNLLRPEIFLRVLGSNHDDNK
jgi:hypothetical protein